MVKRKGAKTATDIGKQIVKYVENAVVMKNKPVKTVTAMATRPKASKGALREAAKVIPQPTIDGAKFAEVYTQPFTDKSVSLPVYPLESHQTMVFKANGTGTTNANGYGYISCNWANFAASTVPCVAVSNGAGPDNWAVAGAGVTLVNSNSPYALTDFDLGQTQPEYQMRIVAAGVRTKYIGTTLNQAGICGCIQLTKSQVADVAGMNFADVKRQPGYKERNFDRGWCTATRHIQSPADYEYQGYDVGTGFWTYTPLFSTTAVSMDSFYNTGCYIKCEANAPFEWEAICHIEVIGPKLMTRKSVADNTPFVNSVVQTYKKIREQDNFTPDHEVPKTGAAKPASWLSKIWKYAEPLLPLIPEVIAAIL